MLIPKEDGWETQPRMIIKIRKRPSGYREAWCNKYLIYKHKNKTALIRFMDKWCKENKDNEYFITNE